ncbi:hypothetical protein IAQ61_002663 [Plenodomus lingam]|uniref:Uncharacterized protein n=1 Tax=Leptosphaeria maculans (strain JN3 / isolate v23.1.3 / race Av1-4-5-6-7-8) TaxID=985895 RepID=E4ZI61_LEPMJ|nr:hypothetical protein LEMA_P062380.1 [Plenodomus lingam JN3]KAH9877299.1 hypothetical protein IAQ61_002663 [Plenodomus lingam]CBX91204.1 hypothetical protein LEMA_P062380.1 [Plenodomus lingam JN3]
MWKRLQGHVREKERNAQIGNPVLLETTYDENQLRQNPNVNDAQVANYQNNAPAPLPSHLSPVGPPNYRASEVPSVTSAYSRPSYDLSYYYENHPTTSPYDISPPSSPEPDRQLSSNTDQPKRFRSMRDVSPMDENRKKWETGSRPISNIPVLRRAPPVLQTGEPHAVPKHKFWEGKLAPNSKVKWDDYSGEPSSVGKAASVSPGSYAKAVPSENKPMGYSATISGPEKKTASLTERIGLFGSKPAPVEPWSRATGRSEIAPALKDDPAAKPLQLPRKAISSAEPRTDMAASSARAPACRRDLQAAVTQFVTAETLDFDMHNDPIKPVVPLKVGKKGSPGSGYTSPTSPTNQGLGIHPFVHASSPTHTRRRSDSPDTVVSVSREAALPPTQRTATPPYTTTERNNNKETPESSREISASRFPWTTYNSGTTYQHSPPPSPPPPLPSSTPLPRQRVVTEPITAASSILSRRRPIPQADRIVSHPTTATTPLRNPSPPPTMPGTAKIHSPTPISPPSPSTRSTLSTTTTTKALPQPPTHISASDHIGLLESQLEDLRIRRTNVYRLLTDLNKAAPPNPLVTDFKRARLVEARKRGFEDELSEIKREEHDVGLKLHRAWKKREREDPGAGNVLWVRRVTG